MELVSGSGVGEDIMPLGAQNFNRPKALTNYKPIPLPLLSALRKLKEKKGWSILEMSEHLGLTQGKLSKILLTTVKTASPSTLKKLEAFVAQNTEQSTTS